MRMKYPTKDRIQMERVFRNVTLKSVLEKYFLTRNIFRDTKRLLFRHYSNISFDFTRANNQFTLSLIILKRPIWHHIYTNKKRFFFTALRSHIEVHFVLASLSQSGSESQ